MFCSKCGAEVPNGSNFCLKCGTPLSPKAAKTKRKIVLPKLGLPVLPLFGAVMLIVGPFLIWVRSSYEQLAQDHSYQGFTYDFSPWAVPLFVLGVITFVVLVLAKGNERRLSVLLTALGAVSLTLVFHFVYVYFTNYHHYLAFKRWSDVREGFYVVGVGAFLVALSGCPLFRRIKV
jgi:uncharacterized membrane protein (DUF485 family)